MTYNIRSILQRLIWGDKTKEQATAELTGVFKSVIDGSETAAAHLLPPKLAPILTALAASPLIEGAELEAAQTLAAFVIGAVEHV